MSLWLKIEINDIVILFKLIICTFIKKFRAFSTGGSMNPARSLGPAIAFSVYSDYVDDLIWKYHYIYWVGPLAGTLFAALMYRYSKT